MCVCLCLGVCERKPSGNLRCAAVSDSLNCVTQFSPFELQEEDCLQQNYLPSNSPYLKDVVMSINVVFHSLGQMKGQIKVMEGKTT